MTISDHLAARLRTVWPMLLGWLAAWLLVAGAPVVSWLSTALDIHVTHAQVVALLGVAAGWAVYELGRWLEGRPGDSRAAVIARAAGSWLLAAGITTGPPTYGQPPSAGPATSG